METTAILNTTDSEIFALLASNNKEKALKVMVACYKEKLYWHIRRMVVEHNDADDLLQETFIKAWKYIDNFRNDSSLYTWLYRIATNNCLTFLETKKRKYGNFVNADPELWQNSVKSQIGFDANKLEWKLQLAINALPEKQKAVFNLRYYNEMPYEQMSEVLETSVGALKASYHHAAKKIEEYILSN